jgi:hypothetical protein
MFYKDCESKYSDKKNAGHESQGACRQDEMNGSKPPAAK